MNFGKKVVCFLASGFALLALPSVKAQVISQWTFEGLSTSGVNASPATSTGSGTASTIGMSLFTGPDNSGISTLAGTDGTNNGSANLTWKVRGTNGWNSGASIASQGAEFAVSTAGYAGIKASFDWYPSTKGEANLLAQYSTDGSTWVNVPPVDIVIPTGPNLAVLTNSSSSNTVIGSYIKTTGGNSWYNNITLDLSGISALNSDANFAFRLVNASTGADAVQATGGAAIDNTSGNWSFDNVKVTGTAIPEPSTYALILGLAIMPCAALRRRFSRATA